MPEFEKEEDQVYNSICNSVDKLSHEECKEIIKGIIGLHACPLSQDNIFNIARTVLQLKLYDVYIDPESMKKACEFITNLLFDVIPSN